MKIELRNVKFVRGHNDTIPYTGDIYVNGIKVATSENDGWGGEDFHNVINKELYAQAVAYCKAMPPEGEYNLPMDLNLYVSSLLYEMWNKREEEKVAKRLQKKCVKQLLVTKTEGSRVETVGLSYSRPIADYLADPKGREIIRKGIAQLRNEYPGWTFVNNNLGDLLN